MNTYSRPAAFIIAALIALRALVPVGYMLSLQPGASFDPALRLCPTQNRTLDLSTFASLDGSDGKHHAHPGAHHDDPAGTNGPFAISTECHAWLGSVAVAVMAPPPAVNAATPPVLHSVAFGDAVPAWSARHPAQPRAPPHHAI